MEPDKWLNFEKIVRFGDTDAAGVIHFYQIFRWCHEAWEESLGIYGLQIKNIFPNSGGDYNTDHVHLPIVRCSANFYAPIQAGDTLLVQLNPQKIDAKSFSVETSFNAKTKKLAVGKTYHTAISAQTRLGVCLPDEIDKWIEASSLHGGVEPL